MSEARLQETTEFAPGTFCWVEAATTDGPAAKKFYTELFGWSFTDAPAGPGMIYTLLQLGNKEVGGLFEMPAEMTQQGIPPHWLSYVLVTNADEAAAKAKELGATLLKGPFDVMDIGRMAVIQDPTGAVFAIWQAGNRSGSTVVNVPNSFCWNELATPNPDQAGEFYTGLFGWGKETQDMGEMIYTSFKNGERPAGGMYKPTPEMGEIPPNWMVYFAVDDTDAKFAKATELGGTGIVPPGDIPDTGRFAVIQDPQGAVFGIIKLLHPPT